jgi:hypothetical protein
MSLGFGNVTRRCTPSAAYCSTSPGRSRLGDPTVISSGPSSRRPLDLVGRLAQSVHHHLHFIGTTDQRDRLGRGERPRVEQAGTVRGANHDGSLGRLVTEAGSPLRNTDATRQTVVEAPPSTGITAPVTKAPARLVR